MQVREYIGVYHADGGLVGEAKYVIGHLLGRTHCSLCDITHSPVRRKKQWDQMVVTLAVPFRLFHLNEMPADVAQMTARTGSPVVLARTAAGLQVLLPPAELDRVAGSVADFQAALTAAGPAGH